jgi:hypothetical protein
MINLTSVDFGNVTSFFLPYEIMRRCSTLLCIGRKLHVYTAGVDRYSGELLMGGLPGLSLGTCDGSCKAASFPISLDRTFICHILREHRRRCAG